MKTLQTSDIFPRRETLEKIVDSFSRARIAVVGDFFLDQYWVIEPTLTEPSIETGLSAHQVVGRRQSPGAAGTVVNNLAALEAGEIRAIGIIGDDGPGYSLTRELGQRGVNTDGLIASSDRFTPTYTKPMFNQGDAEREGERIDIINRTPTPPELEDKIVEQVAAIADQVDAVVLLDQVAQRDVGVLTSRVRQEICRLARKASGTIFYADSRCHIGEFRDVVIKPNEREALAAVRSKPVEPTDEAVLDAARTLFQRTGKPVFLTRGDRGILLTQAEGQDLIAAIPVDGPLDICGAGDSATAGIILGLASGATPVQAALLGNVVASRTVVQIGKTGTTTRREVIDTLFPGK